MEAKTVDPITGEALYFVFDSDGRYLPDDGVATLEKQRSLWIEQWGKVSPELLDLMQTVPQDAKLPVGIWLRMRYDPALFAPRTSKEENSVESLMLADEATERFFGELLAASLSDDIHLHPYLGAPALWGELTVRQIQHVSRFRSVANIYYSPSPVPAAACDPSWTWVQTVGSDKVKSYYGYDGIGQTVCVIEPCYPDDYSYLKSAGTYFVGPGSCQATHPKHVSATVANTYPNEPGGIAVGSLSYFANWQGTPHGNISDPVYNGCRANGYHIWNFSHTTSDFDDRYFDYWVKRSPFPFISIASGNVGQSCDSYGGNGDGVSPCSFNTMIVNATQDANTSGRSDDTLATNCWGGGCWRNPCPSAEWCPHGDRELPLISAPGTRLRMLGTLVSGTSFASPTVAGAAALLHQQNESLKYWPEAVRAILMASASNDVEGTFFRPDDPAIDEKDGAGELDAYVAVAFLGSSNSYRAPGSNPATFGHSYGYLNFSSDCPTGLCSSYVYLIQGNGKGWPVRVVLTFDATASCTDASNEASCASDHLDADLDLRIRDTSNGSVIARSLSWDNSVEFVQFTPTSSDKVYRIEIWKSSNTEPATYFGLAWLTYPFIDNP